jgi:hypothetical protein
MTDHAAWSWLFAHQAETGEAGKPDHNRSQMCPHCPPDYTPRGVATADNLATDH